jgi:dTDP-4-dehydrorhamnose reductase
VEHGALMRVLLTGASGQLGHDLIDVFADHEVIAGRIELTDRDQVVGAITTVAPDVVVHAGAWTAVDACESDPDKAFAVNALGTRHVADGARLCGAHAVYVSTDYVFDGTKATPYNEWDATNPQSVYGRSKLAGEREITAGLAGATIVRTSWVCGLHGNNFIRTMLRLAGERDTWGVVADQRGCPTFTADLAVAVRRLAVDRRPGLFHVSNQGETTWYDLAREVLTLAGADPDRINSITTAEYAAPAPRPANSVLDNAALRLSGLPLLPDYHDTLERFVKELTQ